MEGIEVVDEEEEERGCLVGDLEGDLEERSGKMASDSRSRDLFTCCTFFDTLPFMKV
jgi:hypothetical protein